MTDEQAEGPTPRQRARQLAQGLQPLQSIAWSLIGIADDLAALRRDSDWNRRHGPKRG